MTPTAITSGHASLPQLVPASVTQLPFGASDSPVGGDSWAETVDNSIGEMLDSWQSSVRYALSLRTTAFEQSLGLVGQQLVILGDLTAAWATIARDTVN